MKFKLLLAISVVTGVLYALCAKYYLFVSNADAFAEMPYLEAVSKVLYENVRSGDQRALILRFQDIAYMYLGLLLTSGIMRRGLYGPGIYVLIRENGRVQWSIRQLCQLCIQMFAYQASYILTIMLCFWLCGIVPSITEAAVLLEYIILMAVTFAVFAVGLNVAGCIWGVTPAVLMVFCISGVLLFLHIESVFVGKGILKQIDAILNPFSVLCDQGEIARFHPTVWIRQGIYLVAAMAIAVMTVNRMDISLRDTEIE